MTAVFGGSFNPVHLGHTGLASWMVVHGYADKVWLMVSPRNPLKADASLAGERLRLGWTQMACEGIAGVTASDFEFTLPRPSYTWQTLTALRRAYPGEDFALAIGADNWLCFDRWARHDWILRNFFLLVYPREGYPLYASVGHSSPPPPSAHGVTFMPAPLFPISSTEIRRRLRRGEPCDGLLAPQVQDAIIRDGAYRP